MIDPILSFGAKRRMRSLQTPILLTLYAVLLALMAYFTVYSPFLGAGVTLLTMRSSVQGYGFMVALQFALLVLIAPAMTAGSISGERERQTLDLLLVTNTGSLRIVLGKLLESFGFLALLVLCSLPMLSLVLLTGGATFGQVLVSVLFLLIVALAGLSVGLFCSTLCRRTVSATVTAYLVMLGIGVLTLIPLWHDVHQIDLLYQAMDTGGREIASLDYQAVSFSINPALGLFDLLWVQTGMFDTLIWSVSYTLGHTIRLLPFSRYLTVNMIFMSAASLVLCGLAALRVRNGGKKRRKGRAKA